MKSKTSNKSGFALIELLLIVGIVLIVLRFLFAHKIFDWENGIVRSIGIDLIAYRLTLGVVIIFFLVAIAVHRQIRGKKKNG